MAEAARTDWRDIAMRSKKRIATIYEENKEQIRFAADTVEVWGAAGFMGWVHGRNGGVPKRLGIPLDLGLTGLLKLVAFMGWAGKYSADLHATGNGFGAYYFGTMGLEIGQKALVAQKEADKKPAGHPLTADEAKTQNLDARTNTIVAGAQRGALGEGNAASQVRRQTAQPVVQQRTWF